MVAVYNAPRQILDLIINSPLGLTAYADHRVRLRTRTYRVSLPALRSNLITLQNLDAAWSSPLRLAIERSDWRLIELLITSVCVNEACE